jgi:hypothetical protein
MSGSAEIMTKAQNYNEDVPDSLRSVLPSGLLGRFTAFSAGSRRTFPAFANLHVTHQVVGQIRQANLDLGTGQPDGADELSSHTVLLEPEDVLGDTRAHLGALAVSRPLLGAEQVPGLALPQMWLS